MLWASLLLAVVGIALGALLYRFRSLRLAFETWVGALAAAPIVLMYPLFLVIFGRSTTTIVMIGFAAGLAPVILKTVEGLAGTRQVLIDVGRSFKLTPAQQFRKILLPAALPSIFVGLRLGLIFAMINIVGVEFLINFGGLGQLINELAERYDLPGTYGAILFVILASDRVLRRHRSASSDGCGRRMTTRRRGDRARVLVLRVAIVAVVLVAWEALAASGLLFRDVVPSLRGDRRARWPRARQRRLLREPRRDRARRSASRSSSAGWRASPSASLLGANRFLSQRVRVAAATTSGPTPKIIFFPVMIMWFGVGPGSKIAMGVAVVLLSDRDQRRRRHARRSTPC